MTPSSRFSMATMRALAVYDDAYHALDVARRAGTADGLQLDAFWVAESKLLVALDADRARPHPLAETNDEGRDAGPHRFDDRVKFSCDPRDEGVL